MELAVSEIASYRMELQGLLGQFVAGEAFLGLELAALDPALQWEGVSRRGR